MNILCVTGIFPPDHGGPATYIPSIAAALKDRKHNIVSVLTLSDRLDHDDSGYSFPVLRIARGEPRYRRMLKTVWLIRSLSKKADVIFINGLALEAILAAKLSRKPSVLKVVGDLIWEKARQSRSTSLGIDEFQSTSLPLKWKALRRLQSVYSAQASKIIVPSIYLGRIVGGWGVEPSRIEVVYNAVSSIDAPPQWPEPTDDLVTVSRLVPWKGIEDLVRVAAENNWSLRVIGDGPLRSELEQLAERLSARATFTGHVAKERVASEIRRGRLFVLNSIYEGLPHVVLEAKAAGVPVLATRVGGTPETITHGVDGWLVPPKDRASLADAIKRLLADSALLRTLVDNGMRQVAHEFSFRAMVEGTETVLQSVVRKPA